MNKKSMLFGALLLVGVTAFASEGPVAPAPSDAPAAPGKFALFLSAVKTNTVDKAVALTAAYPKTSLALGATLIAVSSFVAGYKIRANMANADDEQDITEIEFLESDFEDADLEDSEDFEDDAEQA